MQKIQKKIFAYMLNKSKPQKEKALAYFSFFKVLTYAQIKPHRFFICIPLAIIYTLSFLKIPVLMGQATDIFINIQNFNHLKFQHLILQTFIFTLVSVISLGTLTIYSRLLCQRIGFKIRLKLQEKLDTLALSTYDSCASGELLSGIMQDSERLIVGLRLFFSNFWISLFMIPITLYFMLKISFSLGFIVAILSPLSLFIVQKISRITHRNFKAAAEAEASILSYTEESIKNLKNIQALGFAQARENQYFELSDSYSKHSMKANFLSSLSNPSARFINNIIYAGLAFSGASLVLQGAFSAGMLVSLLSYASSYSKPFAELSEVLGELQNSLAASKRILNVLNLEDSIVEQNVMSEIQKKTIQPSISTPSLELDSLSFAYQKDKQVLKSISFTLEQGKKIAIVGASGSGKTSLLSLILRFYPLNQEGQILMNQTPLEKISPKRLRETWGCIFQDAWLKSGTIRNCLCFASKTPISETKLIETAKSVYCHDFIMKLPGGYDAKIPECLSKLSEGQKQLLSICRLLLSEPTAILLDEATASLDSRTEKQVQDALNLLMHEKSALIVAHRLSTIQNADEIILMDKGEIIERGSHEALLNKKSAYYDLFMQSYT